MLLHSGLQTSQTDFTYQREELSKSFSVIQPDLRGHGQSGGEIDSSFFESSIGDLEETLNHLQLEQVQLVGASLGALVALMFTKRHPERVKSLTLSGITATKPSNWTEIHRKEAAQQKELMTNEEACAYFDAMHVGDWRKLLHLSQDEEWYPFHETGDVEGLKMPLCVIVGEQLAFERETALFYKESHPDTHIAVVPLAGHNVHQEQPKVYTKILKLLLKQIASQ